MGVRRCLARSLTSLAFRCALQRVQTVPAAIHSGRIPPSRHPPTGDGRLSQPPHHTGHGPFRTRPPTSVKSPFRARNNRTAQTIIYRKYVVAATRFPSPLRLETISGRNGPCPVPRKPPPESSVPGETLPRGSRRNQLRRGHGSPPVLSEVPHELSIPMRTPKSANGPRSNSFRPDSPSTTTYPRGRKTQPAPSPHRTWSVPDASSGPQLNLHTEKRFPPHQAETFFLL